MLKNVLKKGVLNNCCVMSYLGLTVQQVKCRVCIFEVVVQLEDVMLDVVRRIKEVNV